MTTDSGKVVLDIPHDRNGSFDPVLIAKYQRRFPEFDTKIISMYARGMTAREIQGVRDTCGKPDARVAWDRDQTDRPCTKLTTAVSAVGPSIRMRRPSDRVISARLAERGADGDGIGMSIGAGS